MTNQDFVNFVMNAVNEKIENPNARLACEALIISHIAVMKAEKTGNAAGIKRTNGYKRNALAHFKGETTQAQRKIFVEALEKAQSIMNGKQKFEAIAKHSLL